MTFQFHNEMGKIKSHILKLGTLVEEQLYHAIKAVENLDTDLAQTVIDRDHLVDEHEIEVEEECLKVLALHQPVAIDLRLLVAILKINSDLERIGDMAVNIAQATAYLKKDCRDRGVLDFSTMAERARTVVKLSLDSLVNLDVEQAREILLMDDEIDDMHRHNFEIVEKRVRSNPDEISPLLRMVGISRNLERIGDHATNIAEDILYMAKGRIMRHGHE